MLINSFLLSLGYNIVLYNHEIADITDDSRDCVDGSIFFAVDNRYVEAAINNGAKTIVSEALLNEVVGINYIYVDNIKRVISDFYYKLYGCYLKNMEFIGIIGTNGKTSISTLIYEYLRYSGLNAFLIGTNGARDNATSFKHENTTPKASIFYKYLRYCYENKIKYIVMELSSIAIYELRCYHIPFKILVYSNFSQDHLDYHKTMDNYFDCKRIPFTKLSKNAYAIINYDDNRALDIIRFCDAKIIFYSVDKKSDYKAYNIKESSDNSIFWVNNKLYKTSLVGLFNIYNILPLLAIRDIYQLKDLNDFLNIFKHVPGRMDLICKKPCTVIIDYAHTPVAVNEAIKEVRKLVAGSLFVVIGCGGSRDKSKRRLIGEILANYDIEPIVTSDNPRDEDEMDIINDIVKGMKKYKIFIDRRDAINYCLDRAKKDDCVLILGKGIEDCIIKNNQKIDYSDYRVVEERLCLS